MVSDQLLLVLHQSADSVVDVWSSSIIMAILVKSCSAQVFISQNASIIMFRGSSWSKKQYVDRVKNVRLSKCWLGVNDRLLLLAAEDFPYLACVVSQSKK